MTSPVGAFRIGRGVLELLANDRGLRQQVTAAVRTAGAGQAIDVPVRADTRGLWRDVRGRLRDERGRFVAEGRDLGKRFGAAMSTGIQGQFARGLSAISGLDFVPIPGRILAIGAAAVVASYPVLGLAAHLGLAVSSAAALLPAMLGLVTVTGAVMLGMHRASAAITMYSEAQAQSGEAGVAAMAAANAALAKLDPVTRRFVLTVVDFKKQITELQKASAQAILPGFTAFLLSARKLLPDVTRYLYDMGRALGVAAENLGAVLADDLFRDRFSTIMAYNTAAMQAFSRTIAPLAWFLTNIAEAAAPLVQRLAEAAEGAVQTLATWIELKRESGELATFFRMSGDAMAQWWDIIGNVMAGLGNILMAAYPAGSKWADSLQRMTQAFQDWSGSAQAQESMIRFFMDFFMVIHDIDTEKIFNVAAGITVIVSAIKAFAMAQGAISWITALGSMGPWGLAIAAVAAAVVGLAGAMTYLYRASEPVQAVFAEIGQSLRDHFGPVLEDITAFVREDVAPVMRGHLVPAIQQVGDFVADKLIPALSEMVGNILPGVRSAFHDVVDALRDNKDELQWLWDKFEKLANWLIEVGIPAYGQFAGFMSSVYGATLAFLIDLVGWFIDKLRSIVDIFGEIKDTVGNILDGIINTIAFFTSIVIQLFSIAWNWVDEATRGKLTSVKEAVKENLERMKDIISSLLGTVKDLWDKAWNWMTAKTTGWGTKLREIASSVKDSMVDAFRKIPQTVINAINQTIALINGMIISINKISPIDLPMLGRVTMPKGFATGGQIRGPGGPTDDRIPIMASDGEFMIRSRAVSALADRFGFGFLEWLNRFDVSGDPSATIVSRPRYASGGLITRTQAAIRGADPLPYVWGAVGPSAYDCSGLVGQVWAMLTGHPSFRRYFTTATVLHGFGFRRGKGTFTIGLSNSHVTGNLAGLNFEAASTNAGILTGSYARKPTQMPAQYYLPAIGDSYIADAGGVSFTGLIRRVIERAINRVRDQLPHPGEIVDTIVDSGFGMVTRGLRATEFDAGGWLQPGATLAINSTGQPERVLPPGEGTQVVYRFEAGSIVLDASTVHTIQDLIDLMDGLAVSARQMAVTGGTA
jgi:phage-related protein